MLLSDFRNGQVGPIRSVVVKVRRRLFRVHRRSSCEVVLVWVIRIPFILPSVRVEGVSVRVVSMV